MSEVSGYLYALRDEAGKAAENLRRCTALAERELAEAKGTLDRLESIASKAELAAELVAASDLEPSMSSDVPPESGLTRIEKEPMSRESKDGMCVMCGGKGETCGQPCPKCGETGVMKDGKYMRLENYAGYTLESHDGPLPKVDWRVDGIVGWDPVKVQCYNCYRTMTGPVPILVIQWALFNTVSGLPGRRCADCWLAAGWEYSVAHDWKQVPPKPRQQPTEATDGDDA